MKNGLDLSKAHAIELECTHEECDGRKTFPLFSFLDPSALFSNLKSVCRQHFTDQELARNKEKLVELARALELLAKISEHAFLNPGAGDGYLGLPLQINLKAERVEKQSAA